ncbi:MAG: hypothetical protein MI923_27440, partial [Phycisphaerales bacterium]|nr:hypothetical protein [Phycisphaerales bacterium]
RSFSSHPWFTIPHFLPKAPGRPARGFLRICVVLFFARTFSVLAVRDSAFTRRRSWIGRLRRHGARNTDATRCDKGRGQTGRFTHTTPRTGQRPHDKREPSPGRGGLRSCDAQKPRAAPEITVAFAGLSTQDAK